MPILGIPKYLYKEPERFTPAEARLNRIKSEIKRIEVLERERFTRSPANQFHLNQLKDFQLKYAGELEARREAVRKAQKEHAEQSSFRSASRLGAAIRGFSKLRARQNTLRARADAERRSRIILEATAARRRHGLDINLGFIPRTFFGTAAMYKVGSEARRSYRSPMMTIPCVQRAVRRQVIFAKGHGGKGHRVPHRFNPLSAIGC